MSSSASYASTPLIMGASASAADANRTTPTTANTVTIASARGQGARVDKVDLTALVTTAATTHRLWAVEGFPGEAITSITFSGTTATVTTSSPHGLAAGDFITVQGARPRQYNVTSIAVNAVPTSTTFTYTMASTPTANANAVGEYTMVPATPSFKLLKETPVPANTVSGTNPAWSQQYSESTNPELFPLVLQPGWQLRATVNDAYAIMGVATGGHF